MFNMFLASQEESRKEFMALETRRLEMDEEERKRDAERDKLFLAFMKDTLAMMMPPPPPHMYSMPPGAYPPVIPTPLGPTQRGRSEEDSEEEI